MRQNKPRCSPAVSEAVQQLVNGPGGESGAIAILRVSRQTLARLYGGMPVQPATLYMVASQLGVDLG